MARQEGSNVLSRIGDLSLVPVVRMEDAQNATRMAQSLTAGGLPCAEIVFRTRAAEEAMSLVASHLPEMVLGAGTVLSVDQAERAVLAGAQFVVSPGFNPAVVDWCLDNDVPVVPGVATPTEIEMALQRGLEILKFFPAEVSGGVKMLKALAGPYSGVRFVPTGGLNATNLASYLRLSSVHACAGSWLAPSDCISAGAFDRITQVVRESLCIVRKYR